ncbi:MAG: tetratricopeptide repeat protein [Deltaproteobacteria bacterium]|nr:tetratricopeptide repeat protein [Deltaproteobacteria bacterium]
MDRSTRLCAIAAIAALTACGDRVEPGERATESPIPRLYFVGGEVCEPCHVAEYELWKGSHHDLAMQVVDETSVLGDFNDAQFVHFGVTTTFYRRDEKFFVRTDGPDGELRDYQIAYVFGFDPLQQYLIEFPGGRLQALSVCWDNRPESEGGQRWFHLHPDDPVPAGDVLHWTGPNQNWNYMCADCHSTNLRKNYLADEDRYETRWEEIDVSCEECHGPGSAHVAWANARAEAGADQQLAFDRDNPDDGLTVDLRNDGVWRFDSDEKFAHRSPEKGADAQLDTCGRCHSRRGVLHPEPVRGQSLLDTHRPALVDAPLYYADGQIFDEVYVWGSFLQSRMHASGVVCTDCHDGHALQLPENPDLSCLGCHRADVYAVPEHHHHKWKSTGSSCVACHMLARHYMGVDLRHDHSFRIPRPDLTLAIGSPNTCTDCHADQSVEWSAEAAERWWGTELAEKTHYGQILRAGRQRAPGAARALAELANEPSVPAIVRATALHMLPPAPQTADAVRRGLGDPDPLIRVAALEAAESLEPRSRLKLVRQLLRDPVLGVRIQAARALVAIPQELWEPGDRARLARPLAEYRAAQMENADRPEARLNLAALAVAEGQLERARNELETALRLGPWFVPAYVNLADLYRQTQREDEAERVLRAGLAQVADSAELSHALGLSLVRQGEIATAMAELSRAAELAPETPRYAYVYGIALNSTGEADRALRVLNAAHRQHPGDQALLTALVTMSRDAGDWQAALRYALDLVELLPEDPGARQLLAEIRSLQAGEQ